MIPFFPKPYEDELLYSMLARYHFYSGNDYIRTTINELFSLKKVTATCDLPSNLNALISNMPIYWGYTIDDLINKYTIFPFYKPFWSEKRAAQVNKMMLGGFKQRIHIAAGINPCKIQPWKYLRFCPKCMQEDAKAHGELYWHRLHQVPGVIVCPIHKEIIQNSSIKTYEYYSQFYFRATEDSCTVVPDVPRYSNQAVEKLAELSEDINWVISNDLPSNNPEDLRSEYFSILRNKGLVSQKGRVNSIRLVAEFINYYGVEFLNALGLMPDCDNVHNWVSLMMRKYDQDPHPLRHILIIKFLKGSVKEFFEMGNENKPFGRGPYPCLNPTSKHYLQPTIKDVIIEYSRNRNVFGTFKCQCGFVYSRKGPDSENLDRYKYTTIKEYGIEWKDRLYKLIEGEGIHLREAARDLKVDLQTIRKYVAKYNIKSSWMADESKEKLQRPLSSDTKAEDEETIKFIHREKWVNLVERNPGIAKIRLKEYDKQTFNWLNYHDKEWFLQNTPILKCYNRAHTNVDWGKRDEELKDKVERLVQEIKNSKGKPIRINKDRIGKTLGMLYILRNNLDKIPLTRQYLRDVCESKQEFQIRRIKWAIKEIKLSGEELKGWRIKQKAGLLRSKSEFIEKIINSELRIK